MLQLAYFQMAGSGKTRNQDALFNGENICHAILHKTRLLVPRQQAVRIAVADGVFSSPAPHLASRFWMHAFAQYGDEKGKFLRQQHGPFCDAMVAQHFGSATTFVSAIISANLSCHICNVGDSRAYRISATGAWQQISHDHTHLSDLIEQGEALADQDYAQMYDALAHCLIAAGEETDFKIHTHSFTLQADETVLLCSDGLSDALSHTQLERIWAAHHSLADKLEALRKAVKRQGYYDDCSVVCATHYE